MKDIAGWAALAVVAGLIATYLAVNSRKARRRVFCAVFGLGAIISAYGWVLFFSGQQNMVDQVLRSWLQRRPIGDFEFTLRTASYFGQLGPAFALTIGAALVFCITTLEQVFTHHELRRRVYPALAWYFVVWILVSTAIGVFLRLQTYVVKDETGTGVLRFTSNASFFVLGIGPVVLLLLGFVGSAWFKFNRTAFQVLFPLASALLVVSLIYEHWRGPSPWEGVFLAHIWPVFWLMAYFYLNAKRHEDRIRTSLLRRVPKAGIFLVGLGILSEFPEYAHLKKMLPLPTLITERVLTGLDLSLILVLTLLVSFGRIFHPGGSDAENHMPSGGEEGW